jgi:membrane-associated phospholipid phosphatase
MSPSRPASARAAAALLALAAGCAAGVALLYLLAVRTGEGRHLDDAARGNLDAGSRAFDETNHLLDTISTSSLTLLGAAIMAIAILRGRPRLAVAAGAVVLGANVTTHYLKEALDRPGRFGPEPGTFPSGHVTVAMSLAMALVLVAPPALRAAATLLGTAYAAGVGVAVIAIDWHRPSDVVGGYLVAAAWAALAAAALSAAPGADEFRRGAAPTTRIGRAGGAAVALLGVAFGAVAAGAVLSRLDLVQVADDRTAFAAASAVCALACVVLAGAVAVLVQRASASRTAPAR